jgi:hypothetical protein
MAGPVVVNLPTKKTFVKVATDVITGMIYQQGTGDYWQTWVDTGDAAPVFATLETANALVTMSRAEPISAVTGIDIYIAASVDDANVRVDAS